MTKEFIMIIGACALGTAGAAMSTIALIKENHITKRTNAVEERMTSLTTDLVAATAVMKELKAVDEPINPQTTTKEAMKEFVENAMNDSSKKFVFTNDGIELRDVEEKSILDAEPIEAEVAKETTEPKETKDSEAKDKKEK